MKKILFFLVAVGWPLLASAQYVSQVWSPDNGDGTYTNPVINADYSDPDVCVGASGEDYYLTASSFQCVPGLPILHSKDLVNWEIINHALTSLYEGDAELEKHFSTPQHGNGVWAPSIRYHGGWYYIYWGDPDFGVYMVKTQDPASKWEAPVCVIKGQGYIDTCPLWDDDGRCYLVNGWANSRSKFASVLTVREMSPDGTRPIGQPVIVFDGNGTENRTCEGPKFYKRDGWYWIMCPAGGVPTGFQLAMRSKSPFGPYEHKIVLAQGKTNINGPHQGGWVHTKHGEDWFLHFQDKEAYGRVVHLNPVDWSSGWPVMGKKGEPVTTFRKPKVSEKVIVNSEKFATAIVNPVESDEFNTPVMGKQWQWHANYDEKFGVPTAFGTFRIYTYKLSKDWKNFWEVPNLLLQKTPADAFIATTKLRMTSKADGQFGGLIMMGLDYSALVVKRTGKAFQLVQMTCKGADKGNTQTEKVIATLKPTAEDKTDYKPGIHEDIYLRLTVKDSKVRFAWSQDGKTFTDCGDEFQMKEGKWIGAKFGFIAAETDPKCDRGWVDADWIRVTSLDEVVWFDGRHPITYQVPRKVEPVVTTALEMWKDDMRQVTGMVPVASRQASIKLSADPLLPADGFRISTKGGQIIIEGGNGRGMAYGLLELSRRAGVSPWIWWGDVVPEKKERLAMSEDFVTMQSPSVAYRGIFINDEDWSLRPWSCSTYEPAPSGHIGPQTYKKIFQLLLRLRANAVWPAMHPGTTAFFRIPGAKAVADSCGIVIGTSHCEPLLRNNVGEWDVKERGTFNYRTNREAVHQYWIERLKEVAPLTSPRLREGNKGVMFTIGMRGIHDSSMEGYKTEQEKFDGLQQVIDDQQELLRQYIGDPSEQMQVFVPYKEVLQLYEKGLQVPDYVTLMWCDDNYGYMTRLSDAKEQRRSGGGGVYYHLSYWGRPHDYLWLTTTQPGLVYNEMRQAYDHNVRKLWLANVHDPKVAGYDLELFLDMAWNIDGVTGETLNSHYRSWLCREFGRETGERLFPAMHEFYRLCAIRRPEFMGYTQVELDKRLYERGLSKVDTVPMSASEAASRLVAFDRIKAVIATCKPLIRPELHDAWFAAIEYPVHAAAAMSRKILSDRHESHQAYEEILSLTARYHEMKNGKWRNLMDAAPRKLPVFEDVNATLSPEPKPDLLTVAACDYTSASDEAKVVQMLGHSMNAVALPKDGMLTYHFEVKEDGDYAVETALIPTQPNDHGDLRYSVCIDDQQPVVYNLKEPFRSEEWKQNVLRGQALRHQRVSLSKGSHTLTLRAIDDHIVVDQWKLAEL